MTTKNYNMEARELALYNDDEAVEDDKQFICRNTNNNDNWSLQEGLFYK